MKDEKKPFTMVMSDGKKLHDVSYEEWDLELTHSVVQNGKRYEVEEPLHVRSLNVFGEGTNSTYVVECMLDKLKHTLLKMLKNGGICDD